MKQSTGNQFSGTVMKIAEGAVTGLVAPDLNAASVSAAISNTAVEEHGLHEG